MQAQRNYYLDEDQFWQHLVQFISLCYSVKLKHSKQTSMSSFVNIHGSGIRRRNSCLRLNTVFQIIQVYKSEFEFPNRIFGFYAADIGMLKYINISSFELYASFGR